MVRDLRRGGGRGGEGRGGEGRGRGGGGGEEEKWIVSIILVKKLANTYLNTTNRCFHHSKKIQVSIIT